MIHDFSQKTVEDLYQTIRQNVDEEKQFVIFDYISDLFAEELEIKDYVNKIQEYQKKMFDKHDVTTKKFEAILKKVEQLDKNYAAQLDTYKGRVDALAKKVLAVSELLAPQKLSLSKKEYANLIKNINLTYQKEVKVQENKLVNLQEEVLELDRDWLDKAIYGMYDEMEDARDYINRMGNQMVLGAYSDDVTLLGTIGQVMLGISGLDLLCDIRDLGADYYRYQNGEELSIGLLLLDVIALIPVIGTVKYLKNVKVLVEGADAASDVVKLGKEADEIADMAEVTGENTDEIREIGQGISKNADIIEKEGAGSIDEVVADGSKSSFADNIEDVLKKEGLSLDEFNELRLRDVATLSKEEKAKLKAIRDSVPMPDADTLMQKVIPASDMEKYMDGTYTQVGGYVTKAEDVVQLSTYDDLYGSLRLDYPESAYKPMADDSIGVIRYTTDETSKISIPYGTEMGGTVTENPPFTGNGFTKATNGEIIPEFKCEGYLDIEDGAQLIEISKDGTETLKAVYSENKGKFIPVK